MQTLEIRLPIANDEPPAAADTALIAAVARQLKRPTDAIGSIVVRKRSLDVRKNYTPSWVVRCDVFDVAEIPPDDRLPPLLQPTQIAKHHQHLRPIIVGMGPAGLFAALAFADAGVRCTVIERGLPVEQRNLHVRDLRVHGHLHAESNLCYGEGGAGTYSDGKLYTRSKHPLVRPVYERLVAMGASAEILVAAHPHVGTNRLIPMMKVLRHALMDAGHDLRFDAKVVDLLIRDRGQQKPQVSGVLLADGTEVLGGPVILAAGHSARDVYAMLARQNVRMERKDFAIGARVEHPQTLIDACQLGELARHPAVGAAEYFLAQQTAGRRGVYSFCMCPGGFILPSPTALGHLNVNGMSNDKRSSDFANAALVAQLGADEFYLEKQGDLDDDPDFGAHVADGALLGLALQGRLERGCFDAGSGAYKAPAQRLIDFVGNRDSASLPAKYSYRPSLVPGRIDKLLPSRIVKALQQGAQQVDRSQLRGYLTQQALIVGVETTTSSPVRIVRGDDRQSISHADLYPCAEGAGYAGGIVSSAIEGLLAAEAILNAASAQKA